MVFVSALLLGAASAYAAVTARKPNYANLKSLETLSLPIHVVSTNQVFQNVKPSNNLDIAKIISQVNQGKSNYTADITTGNRTLDATYNIATDVWLPSKPSGVVQVLVHGLGIDRRYWDAPVNTSLSYVKAALAAGHTVVSFDRFGQGASDHPDGLNIVQAPTEVEVLHGIIAWAKKDSRFSGLKTYIAVGQASASVLIGALVAKYPTDVDKILLTSFAPVKGPSVDLYYSLNLEIAAQQDRKTFAKYANDTAYWASGGPNSDLYVFFTPGGYADEMFNYLMSIRAPWPQGIVLTLPVVVKAALGNQFGGEVLVLTGKEDLSFCGGNCYQTPTVAPGTNLVDASKALFPKASKFSTYIPDLTGLAINYHSSGPSTFDVINSWINGTYA